jgi:hypothetical protein
LQLELEPSAIIRSHAENLAAICGESNPSSTLIEAPKAPCSAFSVRVFAQREELTLDLPELLRATRRYFDATLEVQSRTAHASGERVQVALRSE